MQGQLQGQGPRPQGQDKDKDFIFYNVQGLARTALFAVTL